MKRCIGKARNLIMKTSFSLCAALLSATTVAALAGTTFAAAAATAPQLPVRIADARPGAMVQLPAGTFQIAETLVPSGVKLRGAGYNRTILVATGQNGLVIRGGKGAEISDLTVQDAANTGVLIEKSASVAVRRVRAIHCMTGFMAIGSAGARFENVVAADNRTGAVFNTNTACAVVNSSFVGNTALGMSLGLNQQSAAFNNLIAGSPLGVYVAAQNDSLALDYNAYQVNAIGKSADTPPPSVFSWRDQTGFDAHSVQPNIEFTSTGDFSYKPADAMTWSPDRATTSGWGAAALAGFKAPDTDIDGQPYAFGPCAGAWDTHLTAPRPASGEFQVTNAGGTTSAGLYDSNGRLTTWLFSNLPLKPGRYPYWLPARDLYGQPIPAGKYELRTAQANLRFKPVGTGIAGNTGTGYTRETLAQISNQQVVFDSHDQPVMATGWSESQINIRSMNPDFTSEHWIVPGTSTHAGIAADGKGNIYDLRKESAGLSLLKIDESTGMTREVTAGNYNALFPGKTFSPTVGGLAALGDSLFLTDAGGNKLFITPATNPTFATGIDVPSPSSPSADAARGLVWMLSGNHIVAVDASGATKLQMDTPVADARGLTVNGNRLALLAPDGSVRLFDCSDPKQLHAGVKIDAGANIPPAKDGSSGESLSRITLNRNGDIAVVYPGFGVRLFGADGKLKREFMGGWYNSLRVGTPDANGAITVYDPSVGDRRIRLDSASGTWKFLPKMNKNGTYLSEFARDGKKYMLTTDNLAYKTSYRTYAQIGRVEGDTVVPLIAWSGAGGDITTTTDFTQPIGPAYDPTKWKPLNDADGKPWYGFPGVSWQTIANGDLVMDTGGVNIVHLTGFDANGVPQYDFAHPDKHPVNEPQFKSPYTFAAAAIGMAPNRVTSLLSDGSLPRVVSVPGGTMAALTGNWGGTDLATFDPAGKLRWFQTLPHVNSAIGPYVVDDIIYSCGIVNSETQVFDTDGLYLGRLGQPKGFPWGGKWLDNSLQFHPFKGANGKQYMLYGDFNECCLYWFEVTGIDKVQRRHQEVTIAPAQATMLAALPMPSLPKPPKLPETTVTIKRLAAPMNIDGDMAKWRTALPTPQVILTPETGSPNITGPADCSAVMRFAYEGKNLYVQAIKFDDAAVMTQPAEKFYLQDGLEMSLNSFTNGFKFNVTHTRDMGDIVMRDRFYAAGVFLDPAKAPRKVTVLDSAADIPERKLIENLYNVDLSHSKVIVTEFKIPLDEETYAFKDGKVAVPSTTPGSTVRIGVLLDDNDLPGADLQKYEVWPATYNTFSGPEMCALATFE